MKSTEQDEEVVDVAIVGAGISGIGAARYLTEAFPGKTVLVFEGRERIGGTWDLFRYPGIRSDSDLHTYGYEFKPWRHESAIAEGYLIRDYLQETVDEFDLGRVIRLRHQVVAADWSSAEARWTLQVDVTADDGTTSRIAVKARWVIGATGYYRYDQGYTPQFEGRDDFAGDVLHPQHWPENYDYSGKKVVIIGSGATAVTMTPAMTLGSGAAAHVTMLQRTPSYVMSLPRKDALALRLTRVLGADRGYAATRRKNIWLDQAIVRSVRAFPRAGRALIRYYTRKALPQGFDVDTHFNPPYNPWDQRLCVTPDNEFFEAISDGRASVVTDRIVRFTPKGILLESGQELEADVIVTATGFNLRFFGGIPLTVDGEQVSLADSVTYRGVLFSGIPNWAVLLGYTKQSWTLRIGLLCRYLRDLMRHMDEQGHDVVVPEFPAGLRTEHLLDLSSNYVLRSQDEFPRQGTKWPWRMLTAFRLDTKALKGKLFDEGLRFTNSAARVPSPPHSPNGQQRTDADRSVGAQ
ncbi:flavin-containing monooxygenase [Amycolatopsis anabasis]|uniref:flavin-containing monooxygenase n=1 Tax=Amycolatopsis anabasis TaxID=1840409 RepID=UPI00131E236F|nr:NAD(P)/FAD-dependent oxidoreductase [Amycolatopsis anabasis]